MRKTIVYRYLGTNGVIESPVHLEDAYYVRTFALTADSGKVLTDGTRFTHSVTVPEEEVDLWKEVKDKGQI